MCCRACGQVVILRGSLNSLSLDGGGDDVGGGRLDGGDGTCEGAGAGGEADAEVAAGARADNVRRTEERSGL